MRKMDIPRNEAPAQLRRTRRSDGDTYDCVICGLPVGKPKFYCHAIDGGGVALHPDDEALYVPDGGDLGLQPVGTDCRRRSGDFKAFCFK